MISVISFAEDVSVPVYQIEVKLFALDQQYVCCASDQTRQAVVLNVEIHVEPVQLLAIHVAQHVLDHLQVELPPVDILLGRLGAHLDSAGVVRGVVVLIGAH